LGRGGGRGGGWGGLEGPGCCAPGWWWPLCALAASSRAARRPAITSGGAAVIRATPAATSGVGAPPDRTPLYTHRNLCASFQLSRRRMPQCAGHHPRERRRQGGAAAVAHGVLVYPPQRNLPSWSCASGRGISPPRVHRPCQVLSEWARILRKQLRFPKIALMHPPDTFCAVYGRA
jgi:hypothetical protein